MLVLSRKDRESVRIGDNIRIFVVAAIDGKVRLGFEVPDDVKVLREELYEADRAAERSE